jgi:hypothetical protein
VKQHQLIRIKRTDKPLLEKLSKKEGISQVEFLGQSLMYFAETGYSPIARHQLPAEELAKLRNTLVSFIRKQEKDILAPMSSKVDVIAATLSRGASPVGRPVPPAPQKVERAVEEEKKKDEEIPSEGEGEKDWKAEYEKVVKERDELRADLYEVLSDVAYTTTEGHRRRWVHLNADIESMRRMRFKMGMPFPHED